MILKIFSIYDQKAKAYITPFFLPTAGMATRTFTDMINDPKCAFSKHPEDYTLFSLGQFNDLTAETTLEKTPMTMHTGLTLLNPEGTHHEDSHGSSILSSSEG